MSQHMENFAELERSLMERLRAEYDGGFLGMPFEYPIASTQPTPSSTVVRNPVMSTQEVTTPFPSTLEEWEPFIGVIPRDIIHNIDNVQLLLPDNSSLTLTLRKFQQLARNPINQQKETPQMSNILVPNDAFVKSFSAKPSEVEFSEAGIPTHYYLYDVDGYDIFSYNPYYPEIYQRVPYQEKEPNIGCGTTTISSNWEATRVPLDLSTVKIYKFNPAYPGKYNQDVFDILTDPTWFFIDVLNQYSKGQVSTVIYNNGIPHGVRITSKDLIDITHLFREDITWSTVRKKTLKFDDKYIIDQIRVRYALFDKPRNGLSDVVVDNYVPKILAMSHFDPARIRLEVFTHLSKTSYTISPWFSDLLGIKQVPTEHLLRFLGYSLKDLRHLVKTVKSKKYNMVFVGYGGTNVNTIHWLSEIVELTGVINLFNKVFIFEPEKTEVSNLMRFPKNPVQTTSRYIDSQYKLALLEDRELRNLSKESPDIEVKFHKIRSNNHSRYGYDSYKQENGNQVLIPKKNTIFYGAPGITYRSELSAVGNFISATHNGNSCNLWLNPEQDSDLQVESYGLIQLTSFFMNQLRMAVGLLETLASDIDFQEKDVELLDYTFDGEAKMSMPRQYNFNIDNTQQQTVATEEQANATW